jgi:hypothetical protein
MVTLYIHVPVLGAIGSLRDAAKQPPVVLTCQSSVTVAVDESKFQSSADIACPLIAEGEIDGDVDGEIDGDVDGDVDGEVDGEVDGDIDGDVDGDVDAEDWSVKVFTSLSAQLLIPDCVSRAVQAVPSLLPSNVQSTAEYEEPYPFRASILYSESVCGLENVYLNHPVGTPL